MPFSILAVLVAAAVVLVPLPQQHSVVAARRRRGYGSSRSAVAQCFSDRHFSVCLFKTSGIEGGKTVSLLSCRRLDWYKLKLSEDHRRCPWLTGVADGCCVRHYRSDTQLTKSHSRLHRSTRKHVAPRIEMFRIVRSKNNVTKNRVFQEETGESDMGSSTSETNSRGQPVGVGE